MPLDLEMLQGLGQNQGRSPMMQMPGQQTQQQPQQQMASNDNPFGDMTPEQVQQLLAQIRAMMFPGQQGPQPMQGGQPQMDNSPAPPGYRMNQAPQQGQNPALAQMLMQRQMGQG